MNLFPSSLSILQSILRRKIGRRASGKAWSAPSPWLSSSVSCLSQPIRCCGMAWSNHLHCEHGEWTEQPWPHIFLSLQPKLDQPQPKHFCKQSVEFFNLILLLFIIKLYFILSYLKVPCRCRQCELKKDIFVLHWRCRHIESLDLLGKEIMFLYK